MPARAAGTALTPSAVAICNSELNGARLHTHFSLVAFALSNDEPTFTYHYDDEKSTPVQEANVAEPSHAWVKIWCLVGRGLLSHTSLASLDSSRSASG